MNLPFLLRILCFCAIAVGTLNAYAQTSKIKGAVEDGTSHERLPFVNVALLKESDSSLVKGCSTDQYGDFVLEKVPVGKYLLAFTSMGYEKHISSLIEVEQKNTSNVGVIALTQSAVGLKGVEIVAQRPFIEKEAGKTVVNVESAPAGTGDNVWELLKKVPGVTIENDSEIKLNGTSGVTILIDDRKTYLSGDALVAMLKNTSTLTVDKIESITNPSEKYDAEGVGGILNIRMKKNNNIGVFGSVYASVGYSNIFTHSEGVDFSARLKKFAVFGGASNNYYPSKGGSRGQLIYPNGTSFETNTEESDNWLSSSKYAYGGQDYKLGADYYLNKNNIVGFMWRMSNSNSNNNRFGNTRIKRNGIVDSSYSISSNGEYDNMYNVLNLNYKHIFDSAKATELTLDFDYSFNKMNNQSATPTNYYWGDFSSLIRTEEQGDNEKSTASIFSFRADFEHAFTKKLKFNAGGKMSLVTNDNNKENVLNGNIDIERTNHFVYKEDIGALYAGLSILFSEKTSMKVGLRGEYTFTEGYLENMDTTNRQQYFDIFPNVTFSQQLGRKNELEFAYRYQIQRPGYYSLNPFVYRANQYSYYSGNPDLEPQYAHNLSLTHIFKHMIFTSVSYAHSQGQSVYITNFNPQTFVSIQQPENIGKSQSVWISVNGSLPIFKWWYCYAYARAGWAFSELNYSDSLVKSQTFNSQISVGQYFTIMKGLTAEISGWFSPKSTNTNFSTVKGTYSINAGLRQSLLKNRLSIRLSVNDIFNQGSWVSEYNYPTGIVSKSEWRRQGRSFWLSTSFNFGKQDIVIRQRKTASEEEQGRVGGGGGGR